MKTTYLVENRMGEVLGWSTQLCEAKRLGEHSDYRDNFKIIKVVGPNRCEGRHEYALQYDGKRYKKTKFT